MDGVRRVNTICLNFPGQASKPSYLDIHHWITNVFGLTTDQVECLQVDMLKASVYVKMVSKVQFEGILRTFEGGVTLTSRGGETYHVEVVDASMSYRTVRVFNLPLEAPNSLISTTLGKYGKVHEITYEKWGQQFALPVFTGVRIVKMGLEADIPSIINLNGHRCCVNYEGQPRTCNICSQVGHYAASCPNRRRGATVPGSYAARVRGQEDGTSAAPSANHTEPAEQPPTVEATGQRSEADDAAIMAELPSSPSEVQMLLSQSLGPVLEQTASVGASSTAPEPEISSGEFSLGIPVVQQYVRPSQGETQQASADQQNNIEPAAVNEDEDTDLTPKPHSPKKGKNRNKKLRLGHPKTGASRSRSRSKE